MKIDWEKESPKVKEACDRIVAAHTIFETMNPQEKERLDYLMDVLFPPEKK